MKSLKILVLILLCAGEIHTASAQRTIIFDLGETLMITDNWATIYATGLKKFIYYAINTLRKNAQDIFTLPTYIEKRLFQILHKVYPRNPDETLTYAPNGLLLPQIMCSWMKGTLSSADARDLVQYQLNAHPEYCASNAERALIKAMTRMMFTPEIFAQTRTIAPGAVVRVDTCKKQGYQVLVLSNWDPESFGLVQQRFPELFEKFDGIVISGKEPHVPASDRAKVVGTGVLKPEPAAFQALLTSQKEPLDAAKCIFIDDRPENCQAAIDQGMQAIQCPLVSKKPDLAYVSAQLENITQTMPVSHSIYS